MPIFIYFRPCIYFMDYFEQIHEALSKGNAGIYMQHSSLSEPLPLHSHPTDQFILVQKGMAYLITETNQYYIPAHNFIWVPAHTHHRISFFQSQVTLKTIYYPAINESVFYRKIGIYPINQLLHQMLLFTDNWEGIFHLDDWHFRFLQSLSDLLEQTSPSSMMLYLPTKENPKMQHIISYLTKNLDGDLSVPVIAKECGYSVRNFSRFFTKEMGMTYISYLKTLRIVKSMEMLIQEDITVSEAGYRVGYSSPTVFSNTFSEIVGEKPKSFQKRYKR